MTRSRALRKARFYCSTTGQTSGTETSGLNVWTNPILRSGRFRDTGLNIGDGLRDAGLPLAADAETDHDFPAP